MQALFRAKFLPTPSQRRLLSKVATPPTLFPAPSNLLKLSVANLFTFYRLLANPRLTMATTTPTQHVHHATVPKPLHIALARAGLHHEMHTVDSENRHYIPFDHITAHANPPTQPGSLKYRVVAIGAGPVGVVTLLKLVETLHEKAKHHHIDCKILLIEKRESLNYPDDHAGPTEIGGLKAGRDDIWVKANLGVWPKCLGFKRFRNSRGEWKTFQEALQSNVDYTVLRHDLLIALGQLCHQVFQQSDAVRKSDSFHLVFGTQIDQTSLETLENSINACILKNKIADFPLARGTLVLLSWGWGNRGAGSLVPNNQWHAFQQDSVTLEMRLHAARVAISAPIGPAVATGILSSEAMASSLEAIEDHKKTMFALRAPVKGLVYTAEVNFTAQADVEMLSHLGKTQFTFDQLPADIAVRVLRLLSLYCFRTKLTLTDQYGVRLSEIDIALHKAEIRTDKGHGCWSKAWTRTKSGGVAVLLGSARISAGYQLVSHLISASVFGEIASHSELNVQTGFDALLDDFAAYSLLPVKHRMDKVDRSPERSSQIFLDTRFIPIFYSNLELGRASLLKQLESLHQGQQHRWTLKVPKVDGWAEAVHKAAVATCRQLLQDKDFWHIAHRRDFSHFFEEAGLKGDNLTKLSAESMALRKKENVGFNQRMILQQKYRSELLVEATKIGDKLRNLDLRSI